MKKFWPFIPLILWILLFPLIGGLIYWQTNQQSVLYISFVSIIAIFNLVWYIVKLSYHKTKMDGAISVGNWMILNAPAYFLIKSYFKSVEDNKNPKDRSELYNFEYTDWELEELKEKNPKKYATLVNVEKLNEERGRVLTVREQIIHGFTVYLLVKIYNKQPSLVNTYETIQLVYANIDDETEYKKNVKFFQNTDLKLFFAPAILKEINPQIIGDVLMHLDLEELKMQFKEERVQDQQEAKALLEKLK